MTNILYKLLATPDVNPNFAGTIKYNVYVGYTFSFNFNTAGQLLLMVSDSHCGIY